MPKKVSRPASKERSIEYSSSAAWKARLSRSPAPSSSSPDSMLATPGLPAGSCAAAALEGERHGDQRHGVLLDQPGLDALRADHALDVDRPRVPANASGGEEKAERETASAVELHGSGMLRLHDGFFDGLADQVAGDRSAEVEILAGRGLTVVDGDGIDRGRPVLHVLQGLAGGSAVPNDAGERRWRCPRSRPSAANSRCLARASSVIGDAVGDDRRDLRVDSPPRPGRASGRRAARRRTTKIASPSVPDW